jgi:hypothetical protein
MVLSDDMASMVQCNQADVSFSTYEENQEETGMMMRIGRTDK